MKITLQLFGAFTEYGGSLELSVNDNATVADIRDAVLTKIDASPILVKSSLFATDIELLQDDAKLQNGDIISIIPPVSGG